MEGMVSAKPHQALAPTHGFEPGLLTSAAGAGPCPWLPGAHHGLCRSHRVLLRSKTREREVPRALVTALPG